MPEPRNRVDAGPAADARPYVSDGVVFSSYSQASGRTSRTAYSIAREEGMRVDALLGEADGAPRAALPYRLDAPRPSLRTDRTRRVPPSVLIGHAAPRAALPQAHPLRALCVRDPHAPCPSQPKM